MPLSVTLHYRLGSVGQVIGAIRGLIGNGIGDRVRHAPGHHLGDRWVFERGR